MPNTRLNTSIELFTGAGGLAIGVAQAGFAPLALVEWNQDACASLEANATRLEVMRDWPLPIKPTDVRHFDFEPYANRVTLLAAGAPCQPFSLGGKHRGHSDDRNMFPEVFRAVRETKPEAVIIENVKGLLRSTFAEYFTYIEKQLAFPDITPRRDEDWRTHVRRLARAETRAPKNSDLRYTVTHQLLNAADYGLPQKRERVFIIAFRQDTGAEWLRLAPTHTAEALLYAQWVTGSYWEEHGLRMPRVPGHLAGRVVKLRADGLELFPEELKKYRWRTVRDTLRGLPAPKDGTPHPEIANHIGNPGARTYPGHTGSPLDWPAKTLKAGDHGVPGGENTVVDERGRVRYFTVREAARLQGFPDEYLFQGAWCEGFRQLGNAVPVDLARAVAEAVGTRLASAFQARRVA